MSNTSYAGSDFSVRLVKEEAGLSLHLRYSNRIGIDSNNKTFQQCNQFKHDLMDLSKVTPLAATQLMFSRVVFFYKANYKSSSIQALFFLGTLYTILRPLEAVRL